MKFVKPLKLYEQVFKQTLKMKPRKYGSLLAMNVGEDRVSLAVSRPDFTKADYICSLPRQDKNMGIMVGMFKNVITNTRVKGLIVGYPSIRIKEKPDVEETKIFIDKLNKTGKFEGLEYTYWSTRLATKAKVAKGRYTFHGYTNETLEPNFDDSATNLLEGYLNCGRMVVIDDKLINERNDVAR